MTMRLFESQKENIKEFFQKPAEFKEITKREWDDTLSLALEVEGNWLNAFVEAFGTRKTAMLYATSIAVEQLCHKLAFVKQCEETELSAYKSRLRILGLTEEEEGEENEAF